MHYDFQFMKGRAVNSTLMSPFSNRQQRAKILVINIDTLQLLLLDERHGGVVGRWNQIFQLLSSENIDGNKVTFCVTVLSGLGGGDINDLT